MQFHFGFYSSLLLITFSQGIVYSILVLKKAIQNNSKPDYWLSLFLFLCSLIVAPWMLGFAGWYDNQPYRDILFYVPFQHFLFIGPVIYFYTQSLLNPSFKFKNTDCLHLIPGLVYILYILYLAFYDLVVLGDYYYYKDGMDKDFDPRYQVVGYLSMVVYFVMSIRYYYVYKKIIVQVTSNAYQLLFEWIGNFLYAFLGMILIRIGFDILSNFYPDLNTYEGSWWFYLLYSIILYYIAITGYSNGVYAKIAFEIEFFERKKAFLLPDGLSSDATIIDIEHEVFDSKPSAEIVAWKTKIEHLITDENLYQNPELTLNDVAKKLNTNVALVSKVINQGFGLNFNDYINKYRIEAIKKRFENGEHKKSTLLGLAFDSGFNSKATFNRAFKKSTGLSPKEFLSKAT